MEYCTNVKSMVAEELWKTVKGFVESPINLKADM